MARELPSAEQRILEAFIDRRGLAAVVDALGIICGEKADHVRSNWQDSRTASAWQRRAGQLDRLAATIKREER